MKKNIGDYEFLTELMKRYKNNCMVLFDAAKKTVVREELGSGGECLHRGFYCPSSVMDIYIENINRGRILKRKPTKRTPDYVFGFDKDNKLVTVEKIGEGDFYTKEVIFRENELEIGIGISSVQRLEWVAVCSYADGRIRSYIKKVISHVL